MPLVRVPSPSRDHRANISAVSPENTTGLRRGKRLRYEPLEWWRCEKVVYGRREPGKKTYVPTIKEIVRIPKDPPKPLGIVAHKSKRGTSARKKTEEPLPNFNLEEGWDDKTPTNGVVIDWFTGNEVSRRTLILLYRSATQLFEQARRSCFPRSLGEPSPGRE
jgi:centromere protein C